jgi:hypothetical protein
MKIRVIYMFLLAGAFIALLGSPLTARAQDGTIETYSFNREACIDECKSRFGFDFPNTFELQFRGGGYDYGQWKAIQRMYFRCVQKCEKRFWDDFDREMDNLQDEINVD